VRRLSWTLAVLSLPAIGASAEPEKILKTRIVYSVPGMDRVTVRRDIAYREIEGAKLTLDLYTPRGKKVLRPAVILIHGGPIPADWKPTTWGIYRSYGELVAASGFVAVTFNHRLHELGDYGRAAEDVRTLIAYVRENAASLGIDKDRLALWAFSGGGALISPGFDEGSGFIHALASYYGILDLRGSKELEVPAALPEPMASQLSPVVLVEKSTAALPPILIARAGIDSPAINRSVDDFVRAAHEKSMTVDLLTLPQGQHAFDVRDDVPRSREVIEATIAFLKRNLAR